MPDRSVGHERIDHTFTFPLFDYDTPVKFQRKSKADDIGQLC